jgi:hypothetical protein
LIWERLITQVIDFIYLNASFGTAWTVFNVKNVQCLSVFTWENRKRCHEKSNLTLLRLGLTGVGYPCNLLIINKCLFFVGFIANCSLILDKYIDVKFLFLCAAMKNINETFVFLNLKNQIKWFYIAFNIFYSVLL